VNRGKRKKKKAQLKRAYVRIRVTKEGQLGMFAGINRALLEIIKQT